MKFFLLSLAFSAIILSATAQTEMIKNGNLSSLSSWNKSGDSYQFCYPNYTNYRSSPCYVAMPVTSGGSEGNNLTGTLTQQISVPSNATAIEISFYLNITTKEVTTSKKYDVFLASLSNSSNKFYYMWFSNLDAGSGYVKYSFDVDNVNDFKGSTANLTFVGTNDGGKPTVFRVDDISLRVTTTNCDPVEITSQPKDATVSEGNTATFDVSVDGTGPFGYYWYKNGSFVKSRENKTQTSDSYVTNSISSDDNGDYYYCIVKNCSDKQSEQSQKAYITVQSKPKTGTLTTTITPQDAINDGAKWQIDNDGIWRSSGTTVELSSGNYVISFNQINHWDSPSSKTVTVVAGGAENVSGKYSSNIDKPSVNITSPNSYACYNSGAVVNIRADISGDITGKSIEYTLNGTNWNNIWGMSTTNTDLSYDWTLPTVTKTTHFQVRVKVLYVGGEVIDVSDEVCVISPDGNPFKLNSDGISYLFWPFEITNANWNDRKRWDYNPAFQGHGQSGHQCADHYAIDYVKLYSLSFNWEKFEPTTTCDRKVYSPLEGKVIFVRSSEPWDCDKDPTSIANTITIQSQDDPEFAFTILHLNEVSSSIKLGSSVKVGDYLGETGSTGLARGPHAHCVLHKNINKKFEFEGKQVTFKSEFLEKGYSTNCGSNSGTEEYNNCVNSIECQSNKSAFAAEFEFSATHKDGGSGPVSNQVKIADNEIKVYPNPFHNVINIESNGNSQIVAHIYDVLGTHILTYKLNHSHDVIDLTPLSSGLFVLQLLDNNGNLVMTKRLNKLN